MGIVCALSSLEATLDINLVFSPDTLVRGWCVCECLWSIDRHIYVYIYIYTHIRRVAIASHNRFSAQPRHCSELPCLFYARLFGWVWQLLNVSEGGEPLKRRPFSFRSSKRSSKRALTFRGAIFQPNTHLPMPASRALHFPHLRQTIWIPAKHCKWPMASSTQSKDL